MSTPLLHKLTPVVIVERIEPLLPFYIDQLGFTKVVEVPCGDRLGFVMLVQGSIELMFQTEASTSSDMPTRPMRASPVCLYFDVADLDKAIRAIKDAPVVVPRRVAPYGAEEVFVLDPAGNTLGFAKPQ